MRSAPRVRRGVRPTGFPVRTRGPGRRDSAVRSAVPAAHRSRGRGGRPRTRVGGPRVPPRTWTARTTGGRGCPRTRARATRPSGRRGSRATVVLDPVGAPGPRTARRTCVPCAGCTPSRASRIARSPGGPGRHARRGRADRLWRREHGAGEGRGACACGPAGRRDPTGATGGGGRGTGGRRPAGAGAPGPDRVLRSSPAVPDGHRDRPPPGGDVGRPDGRRDRPPPGRDASSGRRDGSADGFRPDTAAVRFSGRRSSGRRPCGRPDREARRSSVPVPQPSRPYRCRRRRSVRPPAARTAVVREARTAVVRGPLAPTVVPLR